MFPGISFICTSANCAEYVIKLKSNKRNKQEKEKEKKNVKHKE